MHSLIPDVRHRLPRKIIGISATVLVMSCSNLADFGDGEDGTDADGAIGNSSVEACDQTSPFNGSAAGNWQAYYVDEGNQNGPLALTLEETIAPDDDFVGTLEGILVLDAATEVDVSGMRYGPRIEISFEHPTDGLFDMYGTIQADGLRVCGQVTDQDEFVSDWWATRTMTGGGASGGEGLANEVTGAWSFFSTVEGSAEEAGPFPLQLSQSSSTLPALVSGTLTIEGTSVELEGTISGLDGVMVQAVFTSPSGCRTTVSGSVDDDWRTIEGSWTEALESAGLSFECGEFGVWRATR